MLIKVDNLNFAYGSDDIFKDARFDLNEHERVGLVGPNGAGKSTFIKLITGQLEEDSGTILINKQATFGYLEQENNFDQTKTIQELFDSIFKDYHHKEERLRELEELMSNNQGEKLDDLYKEYDRLQEYTRRENIYSSDSYIRGLIKGLNLSEDDLKKPFESFSGGEKTRVILAMILVRSPDILILDEPTNFLDPKTLNWLEKTLKTYPGSVLLVSHDRYFLNEVCNRIVEVDKQKLNSYPGNYDNYVRKKEVKQAEEDKRYELALKEFKRQQDILRRYRDINSIKSSKHAKSREKVLEKFELPEKGATQRSILFYFTPRIRSGDIVLTVNNLSKKINNTELFSNVNFIINRGDKVGIIGDNGIGKTTLLNILRKKLKADSGSFEYGAKVKWIFFDQETQDLNNYEDFNLIDVIRESKHEMTDGEIRNFLASFLFTGEDVFKQVKDLSGGEKVRIKLAQIMLSDANFLIMDEPTNHIDMATREILENILSNYQGTLLFVSHDRYFLNRIADRIFEFTPNGINEFLGNYDDYLNKLKQNEEKEELLTNNQITRTEQNKRKRKTREFRQYKAKLITRVNQLEKLIEESEDKIQAFEAELSNPDFYKKQNSKEIIQDYNNLKEAVKDYTDEWEEASIELEEIKETS